MNWILFLGLVLFGQAVRPYNQTSAQGVRSFIYMIVGAALIAVVLS